MSEVIWLSSALADLDRCYDFLLSKDEETAKSALAAIFEAGESLSYSPLRCPTLKSYPDQRRLKVHWGRYGYFIYFKVEDDNVYILSVWHGRENRPS